MDSFPQSVARRVPFKAYLASDHLSPATGKTIAVTISKNGGAFGNPSAGATNATEIGNGWYYVDLSTTDFGTLGPLVVRGAEGTIDTVERLFEVVNANNGGFAALPNAAAEAAGGIYTRGTGAGQINQDANGRINANAVAVAGTAQTAGDLAAELAKVPKSDGTASWNATALAAINAEADTALADAGVTPTRTGYLDNLNVGGLVASSAQVAAIQNNTRATIAVPEVIERPDSGTVTYRVELCLYDETGNMEAPDSAPTIALVNQSGTDRSSRLDSTTMALVSTGRYRAVYTADAGDALEQLVWAFSVTEGGATRILVRASLIVDTTAVDFTAADRTKLDTLHDSRLTAGRASNLDNLDAAVSSRATPAQVNTEADTALADAGVNTTVMGRLDVAVSTRLATAGYTAPPSAGSIADAVYDEARSGHNTPGTFGHQFNIIGAVVAGKVTGAGTGTEVFSDIDGVTVRGTCTVDGSGNRSNWVYA